MGCIFLSHWKMGPIDVPKHYRLLPILFVALRNWCQDSIAEDTMYLDHKTRRNEAGTDASFPLTSFHSVVGRRVSVYYQRRKVFISVTQIHTLWATVSDLDRHHFWRNRAQAVTWITNYFLIGWWNPYLAPSWGPSTCSYLDQSPYRRLEKTTEAIIHMQMICNV